MKKQKKGILFQNFSIAQSFILVITAIILFVAVVMTGCAFYSINKELEINTTEYSTQLLRRVNAEVEQYVGYMKDISDYVIDNPLIQDFLKEPKICSEVERESISRNFLSLAQIRREVSTIALVASSGEMVFSDSTSVPNQHADYAHSEWYTGATENPDEVYVSSSHVQNLIEGRYNWVISFSKAVVDASGEIIGVLLLDLNYEEIDRICTDVDLGDRGYIYILDRNQDILWHPRQDMIYANLADELPEADGVLTKQDEKGLSDKVLEITLQSDVTGWIIVGVAYLEELQENPNQMYAMYICFAVLAIAAAIALAIYLTRTITGPLYHLSGVMQQVEQGDFSVRCEVVGKNEVAQLSKNVNHMIAHTRDLMNQLVHKEEQKREREWKILQAQIKPHFVYNTLESVIWMCRSGKTEEAAEMASALAVLLRRSIGSDKEIITVEEEINHIESYLVIQKMRYKEKLHYTLDIDPATLTCRIPRLIIQPLVENAIYHGIKIRELGGAVTITTMADENGLLITVEDDGVGMTEEKIEQLFTDTARTGGGIGIRNVNDRIKTYLGDQYGLTFYSEPDKGTTAMLRLPMNHEEVPDEE